MLVIVRWWRPLFEVEGGGVLCVVATVVWLLLVRNGGAIALWANEPSIELFGKLRRV